MATLQSTKVDLTGLLEVLGKNLYSAPSVAVRELIQNAHDACVRHSIESSSDEYRIDITTHANLNSITITDNGSGLTYNEIENFLATIGSGYTRIMRNNCQTQDMIGYFGLGFLSAYVVADRVEVSTTSYQTPDQTWLFSSNGGHRFSIQPTETSQRGTAITLHLKQEHHALADIDVLAQLIQKYCCMLPIKIYLNQADININATQLPEQDQVSAVAYRKQALAFAQLFEQDFDPICTIPIQPNEDNVEGLIWIQDGGLYATNDNRNVNIFVRNMFITKEHLDLLPKWAGFCGCVVNTPNLTPTASRESLQTDEHYERIQRLIERSLIEGLKILSESEPENWRRILRRHNQGLLGAAIADDGLFHYLKGSLKLPTTMGDMAVDSLLKKASNRFIIQPEETNGYQAVLFKAQMIPVVQGYYYGAQAFCHKYSYEAPQVQVVTLGVKQDASKLFTRQNIDSETKTLLEHLFKGPKEELFVTEFEPQYLPLIVSVNHDAKVKQRIESDEADKRIGNAILALARSTLSQQVSKAEKTVFVNMKSSIIEKLMTLGQLKQIQYAAMIRAFTNTLMQDAEQSDYSADMQTFFEHLTDLIGE